MAFLSLALKSDSAETASFLLCLYPHMSEFPRKKINIIPASPQRLSLLINFVFFFFKVQGLQ